MSWRIGRIGTYIYIHKCDSVHKCHINLIFLRVSTLFSKSTQSGIYPTFAIRGMLLEYYLRSPSRIVKAHQVQINNQASVPLPKPLLVPNTGHNLFQQSPEPLSLSVTATQQPLAIFTGALRRYRSFSSRHPLTNQFLTSPSDVPILNVTT